MKHFVLIYEFVPDYLERRSAFRDKHLSLALAASHRGELLLAGAFANPADGALLIFESETPQIADQFAQADPYVRNGLVQRWCVREWTTVIGERAAMPVRG